jgi:hypothetical protein
LGKKYRVESSDNLDASSWKEVVNGIVGQADVQELPIPDSTGSNAVFFRVSEQP